MREIKLSKGKRAMVDDEDYDYLNQFRWYAVKPPSSGTYYAYRKFIKESGQAGWQLMHREIIKAPTGIYTDHRNGDGLDNRKENLRLCNNQLNQGNRKNGGKGSSIYRGVSWREERQKWRARIMFNCKEIHLGYYETEEEAALEYNNKAREIFGEFAELNIVSGGKVTVK